MRSSIDHFVRSKLESTEGFAMRQKSCATGRRRLIAVCIGLAPLFGVNVAGAGADAEKVDPVAIGYDIFHREWLPNDARAHGGDGLGPVYNDTSCVACHNSGGSGGAGPVSKNIDILNATSNDRSGTRRGSRGQTRVQQFRRGSNRIPAELPRGFSDRPDGRAAQVRQPIPDTKAGGIRWASRPPVVACFRSPWPSARFPRSARTSS